MERLNAWNTYDLPMQDACMEFAKDYMNFLDEGKTERECVDFFVAEAEKNGYMELGRAIAENKQLKAGDCVYSVWMNKSMVLFRIGEKPFEEGINILGAHIDSPRLDVKQNPLYEDGGIGYLDTHYYGGIKKYQYVTLPLAIHGVVVKKTGETVIVNIGEEEDDPVFFISDLLPHLAQEQMKKNAASFIDGEALDLVIGNKPVTIDADTKPVKKGDSAEKAEDKEEKKAGKEGVTKALLRILKDEFGIEEEDFISAELEIVPAGKARDAGFDRSMVLAYGQDDRVCAYPSFRAQMEVTDIARTSCTLLVDKEEIGSVGATGMQSRFFENALAEVMQLCGQYSEIAMRRTLANSAMLSSDVSAAFDPSYAAAFEKKNACMLGGGMVFNKFTGSRGKSGSNDANAEYLAFLRNLLDGADIRYQTSELGKVDEG
ncbi:MAG: aminopeptidase, partial [Lachnospiraceae bacterium]|nr:aminopeptidase [Lachnospiraceae bacterium]